MLERRRFHTIKTATFEYNCCRTTIYKLLGQGKIRAKKLGKKLLLEDDSMREYFTSLPDAEINVAQPSKSKLNSGNASGDSNSQASQAVEKNGLSAELGSARAREANQKCLP